MISYEPLFDTMKKRHETTYTLIKNYGINPRTIHNMKNNKGISTYTLEKLCHALKCTPNEIIEFYEETE